MGKLRTEGTKWFAGLKVKDITKEPAQAVFHAGCALRYDRDLQNNVRSVISILINAGIDIGIMGESENCCGGRAHDMGYKEEFTKGARNNIKAWTEADVKMIVTSCAHCYHAIKRYYKKLGLDIPVVHTVELIDQLIKENKITLTKNVPLKVTYHDPCHLGRLGEPYVPWNGTKKKVFNQITKHEPPMPRYLGARGIYEPPRNVLKAIPGIQIIEMERIKEYSWCCGAGGGVRESYPEFASWTGLQRLEEAKSTGAEAIVTTCPWCERNFIDSTKTDGQQIQVYDIIDLVKEAI